MISKNYIKARYCWLLFLLTVILLAGCATSTPNIPSEQQQRSVDALKSQLVNDIQQGLTQAKLSPKAKAYLQYHLLTPLLTQPTVAMAGPEALLQPAGLQLQLLIEQSILKEIKQDKIARARLFFHTPKPITPLDISLEDILINGQQQPDIAKIESDRAIVLRRMLRVGPPLEVFLSYPKESLSNLSSNKQQVFNNILEDSNNKSLRDLPLMCNEVPNNISGATYVLSTPEGGIVTFSVNGQLLNQQNKTAYWRFWFGSAQTPAISKRIKNVYSYLGACSSGFGIGMPFFLPISG